MLGTAVFLLMVIAFVIIVFAATGVRVVRPWQKGVIERLGKYMRTADSGITLIIPMLDIMRKNTRSFIRLVTFDTNHKLTAPLVLRYCGSLFS